MFSVIFTIIGCVFVVFIAGYSIYFCTFYYSMIKVGWFIYKDIGLRDFINNNYNNYLDIEMEDGRKLEMVKVSIDNTEMLISGYCKMITKNRNIDTIHRGSIYSLKTSKIYIDRKNFENERLKKRSMFNKIPEELLVNVSEFIADKIIESESSKDKKYLDIV